MDDSENLKDIYKSAITAMKKEVKRLKKNIEYQTLLKKYEKHSNKISILKNDIKLLDTTTQSRISSATPSKSFPSFTKIESVSALEYKLSELQEQLSKTKDRIWKEEEELESRFQCLDPALYLTVTKFTRVSRLNQTLKIQLKKTANQRKSLNFSYSRVTSALIKEPSAGQKIELIERLEKQIQEKDMRVKVLSSLIEQLRYNKSQSNSEVQKIFAKINQRKAEREECQKKIESLEKSVQETLLDIRMKMVNPELPSSVVANLYCRGEIKKIQLEIAEKSRQLKELENQKLFLLMKYSEKIKDLKITPTPKLKRKKGSGSKSISTFSLTARTSSRLHNNYTPFDADSKKSCEIVSVLSKERDNVITKDLVRLLEPFAPGRRLTEKIIAFNRSDCFLSKYC